MSSAHGSSSFQSSFGKFSKSCWSAVGSFVILKVIDLVIGLRVTKDAEVEGLDINLHGEVVQ